MSLATLLPIRHPAKYSSKVLDTFLSCLGTPTQPASSLLDPFAGTGLIHQLRPAWETWGIEIEPEWADLSPYTVTADCLSYLRSSRSEQWDAIATSPTFGNRLADHHDAKDTSYRVTYKHSLGRNLHPNNTGSLPWGHRYREFHYEVWVEAVRVLRRGGAFLLHMSDHIKKGEVQPVSEWHATTLEILGLEREKQIELPSRRMRYGANRDLRLGSEWVYALRKP